MPLNGVVRGLWRDAVPETDAAGRERINRVTYEVAVLEALREQLRCKEVWVVGADRYRNPDEDLPADFDAHRDEFYETLEPPLDADRFIAQLREEVRDALHVPDSGLEEDNQVRIGAKGGGWITLTPLDIRAFFAVTAKVPWPRSVPLTISKRGQPLQARARAISPRRTRHTTAPLASISCPSRFERHHAADPGRGEFPGANGALAHPHAPQIRRRCAIRRSQCGPHATCLRNVPSNRQGRWLARQGPPKHRHPRSPTARAA